jgi:uncharacterized protein with FMN-binding domain
MAVGFSHGLFAFENQTFENILKKDFSKCELKKENVFLKKSQIKLIENNINKKVSALLLRYQAVCNKEKSFIYIDSHNVRTLNETVVIEIKKGKVTFLKIASFMEPKQYQAPKKWLDLFLTKDIKNVDALTGATLSQNAIKNVLRKYLVIDKILKNE